MAGDAVTYTESLRAKYQFLRMLADLREERELDLCAMADERAAHADAKSRVAQILPSLAAQVWRRIEERKP